MKYVNAKITCSGANVSVVDLLPPLRIGHVGKLTLQNSCLTAAVPVRGIMDRLGIDSIRRLAVTGEVVTLSRGQLANLTDVKHLTLDHNNITELEERLFHDLKQVNTISLKYNHISALPENIFQTNKKLTELHLSNNWLQNITSKVLSGLHHLMYLDLSRNRLKLLAVGGLPPMFPDLLVYLDLSHNLLSVLPDGLFDNNKDLDYVDLSHNRLENITSNLFSPLESLDTLDLSNNSLYTLDIKCKPSTKVLFLVNNQLTYLTDDTVEHLWLLDKLSLHNNPWRCWCEDLQLVRLVSFRAKNHLGEMEDTKCQNGRLMMELVDIDVCPVRDYFLLVCVFIVITVLLVTALTSLCYRGEIMTYIYNSNCSLLRLLVTHPDDINQHLQYDIFISFTHEDDQFVTQHLLPQLEGRYKLCLHFRDWMPGEMIGMNVIRSIISSRRTIIVMSPQYLRSTWGSYEFEIAHMEGFSTLVNRMVVIMYQDIDNIPVRESVKLYMRTVTYLKWDDTPHFWKRLHYVLPHPPEDSSRIHCVLGWCWRRQRREERYVDQEEHMGQMLRLHPNALVSQVAQD